jgi:hypothetical protein
MINRITANIIKFLFLVKKPVPPTISGAATHGHTIFFLYYYNNIKKNMNWFVGLTIIVWLGILTNNQLKIKKEADKYKDKFSGYEDDYSQYQDDYNQYKQIVTSICTSGIDVPIEQGAFLKKHYTGIGTINAPLDNMILNIPMPSEICTNPIFSNS